MEEEAAVIHVDAAHHGGAVIADVALGVEETGRELVDAHPRPEQRHIIGAGQPEDELLVRDARKHQPDVHAPLCRRLEGFQHGLAHREVGRIDIDIPLGLIDDIQVDRLGQSLFVQRAVPVGLYHSVRLGRQGLSLRHKGRIILLAGAEGVPVVEEHHREVPDRRALGAESCVLPVAEPLFFIDILVGQIDAARIGCISVHDHDLPVVAVIHDQRHQRHHRVKRDTADMRPLHLHHEIGRQTQQTAEIVVDEPDIHPLCRLADKDVLYPLPHLAGADDEELEEDEPLCLFEVGQQVRVHGLTAGVIFCRGVFPCGVRPVLRNIPAQSPAGGVEGVGLARLLGEVGGVLALHRLHPLAHPLGGGLVAEGQIERTAQQRHHADEDEPDDLIVAVLVLPHEVEGDEEAEDVQPRIHPHLSGGEGEEGPEQPADLQQNKGHCDRGPVDDTIEEPYDRQPKEHLRLPRCLSAAFLWE